MKKYLLDTNVISEWVKPIPDSCVIRMIQNHYEESVIATPVWHELLYGCYRLPVSRKRKELESFIRNVVESYFPILPYDERSASWHAIERARLSSAGQTPSFVDGQIAAIAKVNGLILITRNISDFEIFSDLLIESWHRPSM